MEQIHWTFTSEAFFLYSVKCKTKDDKDYKQEIYSNLIKNEKFLVPIYTLSLLNMKADMEYNKVTDKVIILVTVLTSSRVNPPILDTLPQNAISTMSFPNP